MAPAREYLKKKNKNKHGGETYRESRSTYRYHFYPERVFIEKRLEICFKIHFYRLLLTWLNWGVNSQYILRRHQREKTVVIGRDRTWRKSQWSLCTFNGRRLRFEFHGRWNSEISWSVCRGAADTGKTTTIAWRKGSALTKETHSKGKHGRQDSWDKGVEGKEEIRVSRNDRRLVPIEEKRNPLKSGVVKSCFRYSWHQAICLKVLRQVRHQDFLCSEIVLNLNFCIILQVVHGKLFHQLNYIWTFWQFILKFQQMF